MHRQTEIRSNPDLAATWNPDFHQSWAVMATFPQTGAGKMGLNVANVY